MGWTFSPSWTSPADIKRDLTADFISSGYEVLDTASTAYGRHYWMAVKTPRGRKVVILVMISGSHRGGEHGYGYKDLDETCGPTVVDCPLRLLDMTDEPTEEYAIKWRERVRLTASARKGSRSATFAVGDIVSICNKRYKVTGTVRRSYRVSPVDEPWKSYKCGPSKMHPVSNRSLKPT